MISPFWTSASAPWWANGVLQIILAIIGSRLWSHFEHRATNTMTKDIHKMVMNGHLDGNGKAKD